LSGGPYSVYDKEAPHLDKELWGLGVPVLGICYGLQEIGNDDNLIIIEAVHLGGSVEACDKREFGEASVDIDTSSKLFKDLPSNIKVWMSHGDQVSNLPSSFKQTGKTQSSLAAIEDAARMIYGIQFHPEVTHTPLGKTILSNFATICNVNRNWTMASFIDLEVKRIRAIVGDTAHCIGAISGGVDSTVAGKLLKEAIGDRFHAVLVDNGFMRKNECKDSKAILDDKLGINLTVVDASDLFIGRLAGIIDPEQKRKIIGNTFIEVFETEALRIETERGVKVEYLLQGTLYPDVIESISFKGPSATIKTHHNVGGLTENMKHKLIEPLRELFKDEVRELGLLLGIDDDLIWRHPFPGPVWFLHHTYSRALLFVC